MRLKKLHLRGFGRFSGLRSGATFELEGGLTVFHGDNEAGKSTLHRFIDGMLFGFKKPGRSVRLPEPEQDRFRPWGGGPYGGYLVYEHEGREYRVERSFDLDTDTTEIYDDRTGKEITAEFNQDRTREYDFAHRHLGLNKVAYRNTVSIAQLGAKSGDELVDEVKTKLANLSGSGGEDVSVDAALKVLRDHYGRIGVRERAEGTTYGQAAAEVAALEEELAEVEEALAQARELQRQSAQLDEELALAQDSLQASQMELDRCKWASLESRLRRAAEYRDRLQGLQDRIEEVKNYSNFPTESRDQLENLGARVAQLKESRPQLEARIAALRQEEEALNQRVGMSVYSSLAADDIESLEVQRDRLTAAVNQYEELRADEARLEVALDTDGDPGRARRWQEFTSAGAMGRAESLYQRLTSLEAGSQAGRLEDLGADAAGVEGTQKAAKLGLIAGLLMAGAGVADHLWGFVSKGFLVGVLGLTGGMAAGGWMAYTLMVSGLIVALVSGAIRFGGASRSRALRRRVQGLQDQESARLQEMEQVTAELGRFFKLAGVEDMVGLRQWASDHQQDDATQRDRREAYDRCRQRIAMVVQQYDRARQFVASALSTVEREAEVSWDEDSPGLPPNLGVVLEEIQAAYRSWRHSSRRLDEARERLVDEEARLDAIDKEISRLNQQRLEIATTAGALIPGRDERVGESGESGATGANLGDAHLEEAIAGFRRGCEARARYDRLTAEATSVEALLSQVLNELSYDDLTARVSRLRTQFEGEEPLNAGEGETQEADNRLKLAVERERRLAEEKARVDGQLESLEGLRPMAEIEEELALARHRKEHLEITRAALALAAEVIDEVAADIHRDFAPRLNIEVGELVKGFTGGKYGDVKITEDLDVMVEDPESGGLVPLEGLSGGTIDQVYIALRLAIARLVVGHSDFPVFLDDSFVQCDEGRLENCLAAIAEMAREQQVILFTCHDREVQVLDRLGLEYQLIELA